MTTPPWCREKVMVYYYYYRDLLPPPSRGSHVKSDYTSISHPTCILSPIYCNSKHYYYYFGVRCARPGESEDTLSVQRTQPHTTNPWKEEKDKTVGDKKERADHANRKALALLLKPASPTPSNTGSLRSSQRHTERDTKLLRY